MEREALFIFLLRYNLRAVKFQVYFLMVMVCFPFRTYDLKVCVIKYFDYKILI